MRVVYLVGSLEVGGLERFVTRMSLRAVHGGEFEPSVLCLISRRGPFLVDLENVGVNVYGVSPRWMRNPKALIDLGRALREIAPDVIHSQVNFALLQQFLAIRGGLNRPFLVTERSCYERRGFSLIRRFLQFRFLRFFGAHYSANSKAVAAHLATQVGVPTGSIPILPNGVPEIHPDKGARRAIRRQFDIGDGDVLLGCVGRLSEVKGQELVLCAVENLLREGLPVHLCLVGDGPMRKALESLVLRTGLYGKVHFVGLVSNVEDYLHAIDILVTASSREGMPNVVLEGMAAGKAIVGTPVGAVPELLDGGGCGLVLEDRGVESLTGALRKLCRDDSLRLEMGRQARRRVAAAYSLERAFDLLLQYYRKISNTT